ncbi:MAG TPA: GNAT family N-acetyltransferase [Candidatus Ozemobacteraceae bacterium]|nr:GNAT family N-acetyltransferase [Candidatus Ozemobacteraceae bacterium]
MAPTASPPVVDVDRLRPDDRAGVEGVAALEREAFPDDAQTAPNLALMARAGEIWVARRPDDGIVGEAIVIGGVGEPRAFLFSLAVTRSWRRRGIGFMLMHAVLESLTARGVRSLELTVDPENRPALGLYLSRLGCESVEFLSDHFGPGRHRQLLRKILGAGGAE